MNSSRHLRWLVVPYAFSVTAAACADEEDGGSGTGASGGTAGAAVDGASGSGGGSGVGGASGAGGAGSAGATGGGGVGGSAGDADASDGSSGASGAAGAGQPARVVLSTQPAKAASDAQYSAYASFRVQAPGGCTTQSIGTCTVSSCDLTFPLTPATNFSAGTIAITGAAVPITLMPGPTTAYITAGGTTHVYQGGETLTFSASGADVPAFVATVQAPPELTVSHPAAVPLIEHSGSEAFIPTWTPVADGQVVVAMNAMPAATDAVFAFCSFPAAAGSGTVPASVMASLAPSQGGQLTISLQREAIVTAASWSVHAIAEQIAVRSDGEAQWVIDVD